jgi:Type ISP C-terminal specificity domain/N-6 DNA Methylase
MLAMPPGRSRNPLVRQLVAAAHDLRQRFTAELAAGSAVLNEARASLGEVLQREVTADEAADILAQAAACAAPVLATGSAPAWLFEQLSVWERFACSVALSAGSPPLPLAPTSPQHLYEPFLHRYAAGDRKRRGVFFTPQPIAHYIVAQLDLLLRDEFNLPNGLAACSTLHAPHSAFPLLLDPACGTGVFLLAAIDHIFRTLRTHWIEEGCDAGDRHRRWNDFVPDLLPRLVGIEILPAAALLAKLNLTFYLAQTGCDFPMPCRLHILTGDALAPRLHSEMGHPKSAIPVILGNPPFSSLSTNTNPWIARLIRGDDEIRGYLCAGGERLGERKTWLHDDYVKFLRLAQWHVEQAGRGVVGFVTNHGYLDNATFRLMRQELLRVFPHIQIVDLHGNRKNHEVAPDGGRDENLFGLDQGLAIGLFSRGAGVPPDRTLTRGANEEYASRIERSDLWGTRESKLAALADPALAPRACLFAPQSPHWRFAPSATSLPHPEYASAWSLADAMPVNTPAPVTARDHFVVSFTRDELVRRVAEFRDLAIPDDEIRRRYFTRTRSARYPPGDTRGWKLSAARRAVAADTGWQSKIVRCLYRPFDWRYVFWHPAMIDWPRTEVTRHLMAEEESSKFRVQGSKLETSTLNLELGTLNYCLIARRQQLPAQPCTFFWVSDGLALDGVIRSDNRGSESLFPLFLDSSRFNVQRSSSSMPPTLNFEPGTLNSWRPNFAPAFLDQLLAPIRRQPQPEETLGYIYALFHSPTYRERYADELRGDFPRVLLPRTAALFDTLSQFGQQLIALHLLRPPLSVPHSDPARHAAPSTAAPHVGGALAPAVASFRAGGYVALKKWLQPPQRSAADHDYARIVHAIEQTLAAMAAVDQAVADSGGFAGAFVPA